MSKIDKIKEVLEMLEVCLYIRPVVTGAGADLSVVMAGRLP